MSPNGGDGAVAGGIPRPELPVGRAGEEERERVVEAGIVDGSSVAAEHGDGIRRRAAARPRGVGHGHGR